MGLDTPYTLNNQINKKPHPICTILIYYCTFMTIFKIKRKQQTIKFGHEEISRCEPWNSCPFHWYSLLPMTYHWLWFPVTFSFHFYIVVVWCEACKKRYLKAFLACPLLIICDIIYCYSLAICYLGYQWFQASSSCIAFLTVDLKLRWNKLEMK